MAKNIHVNIFYNLDDLTFMLESKEFRRMMGLSKAQYLEALESIPDDIKQKRGRFTIIAQKNWNDLMRDTLEVMRPIIAKSLKKYAEDHHNNIDDYECFFGYCTMPSMISLFYRPKN